MSGVQQRLIEGRHVILIHLQTSHADEDWGIRVKNPGKGPLEFARTLVINNKPWSSEQKRMGASGTHTGSDRGYFRYFNSLGFLHSSFLLTFKKIFPKIHFASMNVETQGRNWAYLEPKKEQRVSSLCGPVSWNTSKQELSRMGEHLIWGSPTWDSTRAYVRVSFKLTCQDSLHLSSSLLKAYFRDMVHERKRLKSAEVSLSHPSSLGE